MSAHSSRTISSARSCFSPAQLGCLRNQDSSFDPRLRNVNDVEGQSTKYALHMASKRFSPNTERRPGKSSAMLESSRNQYWRL